LYVTKILADKKFKVNRNLGHPFLVDNHKGKNIFMRNFIEGAKGTQNLTHYT